jgi:hypothetical protein
MVRHCISCAKRHNSVYQEIEYFELHKNIDAKIKELFMGIDFRSHTNHEQLEHAIISINKLRLKKPVRITKPDKNSRMALKNTILAYRECASKSELRWVCMKCSLDAEEINNPYCVSHVIHNYGVL